MGIVHVDDLADEEFTYAAPFDAEKLSFSRDLGKAAGSVTLGVWRERLPPGRRTSFTHAHSAEEEVITVLAGTCHVRTVTGGVVEETPLRAGHVVVFPAGTGAAHTFVNHGAEDAVLLVIGERRRDVDRVFYPEDAEYEAWFRKNRPERFWDRG